MKEKIEQSRGGYNPLIISDLGDCKLILVVKGREIGEFSLQNVSQFIRINTLSTLDDLLSQIVSKIKAEGCINSQEQWKIPAYLFIQFCRWPNTAKECYDRFQQMGVDVKYHSLRRGWKPVRLEQLGVERRKGATYEQRYRIALRIYEELKQSGII